MLSIDEELRSMTQDRVHTESECAEVRKLLQREKEVREKAEKAKNELEAKLSSEQATRHQFEKTVAELDVELKQTSGVVSALERDMEKLRAAKVVAIASREKTEPALTRETEVCDAIAKELIRTTGLEAITKQ